MSTETLPTKMKAVRVHEFGGPEKLELEEIPLPCVTATQVLVRIHYSGINYIDTYHRTGLYPNALPLIIGRECAGVIVKVGENVPNSPNPFKVGDRVALFTQGTYAEYVAIEAVAPLCSIARLPDSISLKVAAASMLQGLTAHYLTDTSYCIKQGDHVLVHAAAGGTGKRFNFSAFVSIISCACSRFILYHSLLI
jgi:NADPH2:quinone reductase